ncbi:MAG: hypothetical protein U0792_23795 [Gemmataceae bacterium]
MTTYFRKQEKCANCQQTSEHHVLGSTNTMGSADLDLRPAEMQRSTMGAWLQECPHCHYIASEISEKQGELKRVASPEYQAILADTRFPQLAQRFLAHSLLMMDTDKPLGRQLPDCGPRGSATTPDRRNSRWNAEGSRRIPWRLSDRFPTRNAASPRAQCWSMYCAAVNASRKRLRSAIRS